jgi:phage terminase large subunit GpA-like protein
MLAIGNEELDKYPVMGKSVKCPHCGKRHKVLYGKKVLPDGTTEPSKALAFYKCGDNKYLAGIDGKNIMERFK